MGIPKEDFKRIVEVYGIYSAIFFGVEPEELDDMIIRNYAIRIRREIDNLLYYLGMDEKN